MNKVLKHRSDVGIAVRRSRFKLLGLGKMNYWNQTHSKVGQVLVFESIKGARLDLSHCVLRFMGNRLRMRGEERGSVEDARALVRHG